MSVTTTTPESDPETTPTAALEGLADRLRQHRQKSRRYLSGQLARLDDIEGRLLSDLRNIGSQLSAWQDYQRQATELHQAYEQNKEKLEVSTTRFHARRDRIASRLKTLRARPDVDPAEIAELESALERAREVHQSSVQECEAAVQRYEAAKQDAETAAHDLKNLQGEVDFEREQRQRAEQKLQEARNALVESRTEDKELRKELATSRKMLNQRAEELNHLRERLDSLATEGGQEHAAADAEELQQLREQRETLQSEVADLRQKCHATRVVLRRRNTRGIGRPSPPVRNSRRECTRTQGPQHRTGRHLGLGTAIDFGSGLRGRWHNGRLRLGSAETAAVRRHGQ